MTDDELDMPKADEEIFHKWLETPEVTILMQLLNFAEPENRTKLLWLAYSVGFNQGVGVAIVKVLKMAMTKVKEKP